MNSDVPKSQLNSKCSATNDIRNAIIFSIALVCFAWISFDDFVSNLYKPGLYISKAAVNDYLGYYEGFTYPEFKICPKTLSGYNDDSLNISIYKLYYDTSNFQTYIHKEYSFPDSKDNVLPFNHNMAYELSIPNNAEFITPEEFCRIFKPPSRIENNVVQEFAGSHTLDNDHK
ncbi:hypothetical protein C1646_770754 [Rhizophagus diaphanus]|nr:hypothetical protein C1646_770754 [Rhizophagus diaphanus] [Rhizophagus sp. MUCL 43196]